jgi:hypothetical protein
MREEESVSKRQRCFTAVLLTVLWALTGCMSGPALPTTGPTASPAEPSPSPSLAGHDLPFETIERGDSDYYHSNPTEPQRMFLVTSADRASRLSGWTSQKALQALVQLDYGRYFAIALFRGHFASSGYDAIIQRVSREADKLVVQVQFWGPSPYYAVTAAETNPYHVIQVLRDGGSLEQAALVLESQAITPIPPSSIRRLTPGATP